MSVDVQALRELLERAVALEEKAAAVAELEPAPVEMADDFDVDDAADIAALAGFDGDFGDDEPAGVPVGQDFDVPDDAPADADLAEVVAAVEEDDVDQADDGVELGELELLRARRAALG